MKKVRLLFLLVVLLGGLSISEMQAEQKVQLRVATYNLRLDTPNDGDDAWPYRKALVQGIVRFHDFDIFGTQEGFRSQLDDLLEMGGYSYYGEGRDGGTTGEHSGIFYKTERFEALDTGDFWFSETPDRVGKGWDAKCCNRICSWVKLQERESGKQFFVFSSHYDHEGVVARRESSKLLLAKIKEIAGDATVFCVGDFNATPEDEPIRLILDEGSLRDAYAITEQPPFGTVGTFNGFNPQAKLTERIDYIFVTKDVRIIKYGVLNELFYGRFASDHFPVLVVAAF